MEAISISVAWLVEDDYFFSLGGDNSRLFDRCLEDIWDLSLWIGGVSDFGCHKPSAWGLEDELASETLSSEWRAAHHMAARCFTYLSESEDRDDFFKEVEEGDVTCLDSFEELLSLLLCCAEWFALNHIIFT